MVQNEDDSKSPAMGIISTLTFSFWPTKLMVDNLFVSKLFSSVYTPNNYLIQIASVNKVIISVCNINVIELPFSSVAAML